MVPSLEAIKGGGGSVKIGTTGTIGTLMSRELESMKASNVPVWVRGGAYTPKTLDSKASLDESNSHGSGNSCKNRGPQFSRKTRHYNSKRHQIPILDSDNVSVDETPRRGKPEKRSSYNVFDIVDIKCGELDRRWTYSITSRLKKLSFSKLSDSVI